MLVINKIIALEKALRHCNPISNELHAKLYTKIINLN